MTDTADPEVMTVEELAAYIGVHRDTIYRLAKAGKIPHFLHGQRLSVPSPRVPSRKIGRWMYERRGLGSDEGEGTR